LSATNLFNIEFIDSIIKNSEWINIAENNFDDLLPIISKETKSLTPNENQKTVFRVFAMGSATNRDEWVYDFSEENLKQKMSFLIQEFNDEVQKYRNTQLLDELNYSIKWSETLISHLKGLKQGNFDENKIVASFYRPFSPKFYYADPLFSDRLTIYHQAFFGKNYSNKNCVIGLIGISTEIPFSVFAFDKINDLNSLSPAAGGNKSIPLYYENKNGDRIDNITDWGLTQFQTHYQDSTITKENIFHYTYAVLHHPHYRTKYELNLKREFPRLPFYEDFHQWTNWGKTLMELHLNYETIQPYGLQQVEIANKENPKAKLKADKINGVIILDDNTQLTGVNAIAWEYKLGNRSALEWILDQYKEKKPKDPTIAKLFNTYKFADYKEQVIDLLQRVCTVSVKTMEIIQQMP
jgi:predicted helicase